MKIRGGIKYSNAEQEAMRERLKCYIDSRHISQRTFMNVLGASHQYINTFSGNPSYEMRVQFEKKFPDLNLEWIITGVGEMNTGKEPIPIEVTPKKSGRKSRTQGDEIDSVVECTMEQELARLRKENEALNKRLMELVEQNMKLVQTLMDNK